MKITIISLLLLMVTYKCGCADQSLSKEIQRKTLFTDAVQKLIETVQGTVKTALSTLDALLQGIVNLGIERLNQLQTQLGKIVDRMQDEVEATMSQATQAGFNVLYCSTHANSSLFRIPSDIVKNVSNCYKEHVKNASDVIDEGKGLINREFEFVLDFTVSLGNCSLLKPSCFQALTKIPQMILSIPKKIAEIVETVTKRVSVVSGSVLFCFAEGTENATKATGDVLAEVIECVQCMQTN